MACWKSFWANVSSLKKNMACQHKRLIPTVKHGGGGVIIWARSAAVGPWHHAVFESTVNPSVYQSILQSNIRPSIGQLKLCPTD